MAEKTKKLLGHRVIAAAIKECEGFWHKRKKDILALRSWQAELCKELAPLTDLGYSLSAPYVTSSAVCAKVLVSLHNIELLELKLWPNGICRLNYIYEHDPVDRDVDTPAALAAELTLWMTRTQTQRVRAWAKHIKGA